MNFHMIIEIVTHGSSLHRRRERFLIKTPEQKDTEISAEKVNAIVIASNSMISTDAIRLCIERQIQLVLTSWYGKPEARLWTSTPGRQTQIRRQQYANIDTVFAFELTKSLLLEKIANRFITDTEFHQHDDNPYRYPHIQYKRIKDQQHIVGIGDAAKLLQNRISGVQHISLKNTKIPIKNIQILNKTHTITDDITEYKFCSPWIALNHENYEKYNLLDPKFHRNFLEKILTVNLLIARIINS